MWSRIRRVCLLKKYPRTKEEAAEKREVDYPTPKRGLWLEEACTLLCVKVHHMDVKVTRVCVSTRDHVRSHTHGRTAHTQLSVTHAFGRSKELPFLQFHPLLFSSRTVHPFWTFHSRTPSSSSPIRTWNCTLYS